MRLTRRYRRSLLALRLWLHAAVLGLTAPLWWGRAMWGVLWQRWEAPDDDLEDGPEIRLFVSWAVVSGAGCLAPLWVPAVMGSPRLYGIVSGLFESKVDRWMKQFNRSL